MNPQDAILWDYFVLLVLTVLSLTGAAAGGAVLFESKKVWFKLDRSTRAMIWFHLVLVVGALAASLWYLSVWVGEPVKLVHHLGFYLVVSSILALPSALHLSSELKKAAKVAKT